MGELKKAVSERHSLEKKSPAQSGEEKKSAGLGGKGKLFHTDSNDD